MKNNAQTSLGPKIAGLLVPLFSIRTEESWGVGEFADIPATAEWIKKAGYRLIALLPLGEIPDGEQSPYSASTSYALDYLYIRIGQIPDLRSSDFPALLGPNGTETLAHVRAAKQVQYSAIRGLKRKALRCAFERFFSLEYHRGHEASKSQRGKAFDAFRHAEQHWLENYTLFRALKTRFGEAWWLNWPGELRQRHPTAMKEASEELFYERLYYAYVQWIAHEQWHQSKRTSNQMGVELMGDLPFMVGLDSDDVWGNGKDFFLNATIGVPGDQFAPEGQDWGLPAYDWVEMERSQFAWIRSRAKRMASLFDRFRIDHLVGYYRTYVRPKNGEKPRFMPAVESAQISQGEAVLKAFATEAQALHSKIIAEDLGTIPPFVRTSMSQLHIAGYRVLIWEKDGDVFRDPAKFPYISLATTGTHDTDPVSVWWKQLSFFERKQVLDGWSALKPFANDRSIDSWNELTHEAILKTVYFSSSELTLLPIQDVLGVDDRINLPGTHGSLNWMYRLPQSIRSMNQDSSLEKLVQMHHKLVIQSGRSSS